MARGNGESAAILRQQDGRSAPANASDRWAAAGTRDFAHNDSGAIICEALLEVESGLEAITAG